jgi:hypothetical protein
MKKALLLTSLICSGLAFGSLSQNAKADSNQSTNPNNNQDQTQADNGSALINKQSITLQQPSENDTNTILSSFTKDSGISTTQDGVSYTVNPQNDGYQIELSQNMGQYNHLLAIYNYNPTTHTYKQIGGTYQADVPMGESLKQNNGNQENSKPVNSQQLGLNDVAVGKGLFISNDNNQSTHSQANQDQTNQVNQTQAKQLPQTGNDNKDELGGLALASLTAMFALGKRKEDY